MPRRRRIIFLMGILTLFIIYLMGPNPDTPEWNTSMPGVPGQPDSLERYILRLEKQHNVKPDNEARIVWFNDSVRKKTPYSVIYLHGFSASQKEGDPVHRQFAQMFGCNLYLARMADHGIDTTEALAQFTTDRYWTSAKEALAIGKAIGDKVIIVSTSTGSTVALMLAAEFPADVHALINLSPNIAINNGAAFILNNPWGLQIAHLVRSSDYNESSSMSDVRAQYWYKKYRLEGAVQLEEMLETKMNDETFKRVTQPSLTLYYYKNEKEQDPEVKVSAMIKMNEKLGTPANSKRMVPMPNTGAHVLGSSLTSKDVEGVLHEMQLFAEEVLKMKPIPHPLAP
jgi:pimeloyl-ACP methyl ester carboxylesterase